MARSLALVTGEKSSLVGANPRGAQERAPGERKVLSRLRTADDATADGVRERGDRGRWHRGIGRLLRVRGDGLGPRPRRGVVVHHIRSAISRDGKRGPAGVCEERVGVRSLHLALLDGVGDRRSHGAVAGRCRARRGALCGRAWGFWTHHRGGGGLWVVTDGGRDGDGGGSRGGGSLGRGGLVLGARVALGVSLRALLHLARGAGDRPGLGVDAPRGFGILKRGTEGPEGPEGPERVGRAARVEQQRSLRRSKLSDPRVVHRGRGNESRIRGGGHLLERRVSTRRANRGQVLAGDGQGGGAPGVSEKVRRAELVERRVEDARVEAVLVGAVGRAAANSVLRQASRRVVRGIVGKLRQLDGRTGNASAPRLRMMLRMRRVPDALGGSNVDPVRGSAAPYEGGGRSAPSPPSGWLEQTYPRRAPPNVVGVQDDGILHPDHVSGMYARDGYHRERARRRLVGGNANGRGNSNGWANESADRMDPG